MHERRTRSMSNRQFPDKQIFEKIACKFLMNLPEDEKLDSLRLPYHYQKAYYFYIDQVMKNKSQNLDQSVNREEFFIKLNDIVGPTLSRKVSIQQILKVLERNKPTCGAIILNEKGDKVLMIETNNRLGFPKGGLNENESESKCAIRQVKEEVGLFIHGMIKEDQKIEFMNRGVKVTYFIVKNFNEHEKIKIDTNQIDAAFWMPVCEVSKSMHRLTQKSKIVWKQFEKKYVIAPKLTMDHFLNVYRKKEKKNSQPPIDNPLLNFKFDRQRLFAVFQQ